MTHPIGTVMICEDGCCVAQLNDGGEWQTLCREHPGRTWEYDLEDFIGEWSVIYTPAEAAR